MGIIRLFEDTVKKFPNKIAVEDKVKKYTFIELMDLSKKLATSISKYDIINVPIGVVANRDVNTIVCILAVLYSGNYYVPIDFNLPAHKLKAIKQDANFSVFVGNSENELWLNNSLGADNFVFVNYENTSINSEQLISYDVKDESALYIVYTSGSTGKPKGVLKSHASMINFIDTYVETFNIDENEIIGNQTPFFFDASSKDLYLMMKKGCTLQIIPTELFSFPVRLIEYMNEKKISYISWVPSALSIVTKLNTFIEVVPEHLKYVFFVGELFPMKQLNKWRKALPDIQYVNLYGSSEMSGVCCYYIVDQEFSDEDILPIGVPLPNSEVFLMDEGEFLFDSDTMGEILVASKSLANCYLNDIEKTNNTFLTIETPTGKNRVLKTGDFAKWDKDKKLVFVNRADSQIKHMGYRIELGEIETIAQGLDNVDKCCCLYNSKKSKIVLFCEVSKESVTVTDVQKELREKLVDYMNPQKIVILDELPINSNGKIDRQLLKNTYKL